MYLLTAARQSKGWSRAELGRRARIHPADIGKLEAGRIFPWPAWRQRLAEALEIPAAELFREVEDESAPYPCTSP